MRIIGLTALILAVLLPVKSFAANSINVGDIGIAGYLQVKYLSDEEANNNFRVRRARFKFFGKSGNHIKYNLELAAGKTPGLNKAYIDLDYVEGLTIRLGQFKKPFSYEELKSSKKVISIERAELLRRDIDFAEDIGLMVSARHGFVTLEAGVFNGEGKEHKDTNDQKDFVGRIFVEPANDLIFGVAGYRGYAGPAAINDNRYGIFLAYRLNRLTFEGEYIYGDYNGTQEANWDGCSFTFMYDITHTVSALIKYDQYAPDEDAEFDDIKRNYTMGANWAFDDNALLKLNYVVRDEDEGVPTLNNDQVMALLQLIF